MLAHARNKRGRSKDRTADVDRRRRRQRRDNPIVDVTGEQRHDNLTAVVSPLLVAGRTASPSLPAGSGRAFFAVPPVTTVPQANIVEDNEDDCACAENARNERGRGEDASLDHRR